MIDSPDDLAPAPDAGGMAVSWYRSLLRTIGDMIETAVKPLRQARTITLWFRLDGGTVPLAVTDFIEAPVDFPFVITGLTILSRTTGAIVLSVGQSTLLTYPTITSICASAPPTLAAYIATDDVLSGWTTEIAGTDILAVGVTSNAGGLTAVSLGLRGRVLGPTTR